MKTIFSIFVLQIITHEITSGKSIIQSQGYYSS